MGLSRGRQATAQLTVARQVIRTVEGEKDRAERESALYQAEADRRSKEAATLRILRIQDGYAIKSLKRKVVRRTAGEIALGVVVVLFTVLQFK